MVQEFRDFIAKGNMIDIAVGFIMGAAFIALIGSLVDNILMPIVAIPFGEPSFDSIIWTINDSQILIGSFITAIVARGASADLLSPCQVSTGTTGGRRRGFSGMGSIALSTGFRVLQINSRLPKRSRRQIPARQPAI